MANTLHIWPAPRADLLGSFDRLLLCRKQCACTISAGSLYRVISVRSTLYKDISFTHMIPLDSKYTPSKGHVNQKYQQIVLPAQQYQSITRRFASCSPILILLCFPVLTPSVSHSSSPAKDASAISPRRSKHSLPPRSFTRARSVGRSDATCRTKFSRAECRLTCYGSRCDRWDGDAWVR